MDASTDPAVTILFNDGKVVDKDTPSCAVTDVLIQSGVADFAKVVLASEYSYTFSADQPVSLRLMDSTGNQVLVNTQVGQLTYNANVGGTYYLSLADTPGQTTLPATFTVTLTNAPIEGDTLANANTKKYISLTTGFGTARGSYTDVFDFKNDADWAAVFLNAGLDYTFKADNGNVAMELVGNVGKLPVTANSLGELTFSPRYSGLYFLAVSNWQNAVKLGTPYTIAVTGGWA